MVYTCLQPKNLWNTATHCGLKVQGRSCSRVNEEIAFPGTQMVENLIQGSVEGAEHSHPDVKYFDFSMKSVYFKTKCTFPACATIHPLPLQHLYRMLSFSSCSGESLSASKNPGPSPHSELSLQHSGCVCCFNSDELIQVNVNDVTEE